MANLKRCQRDDNTKNNKIMETKQHLRRTVNAFTQSKGTVHISNIELYCGELYTVHRILQV